MGRWSLLVVDDDAAVREQLSDHLNGAGHEVRVAGTGAEADVALRDARYDAILLAAALPDASGLEILFRYRSEGGRTPVVVLSAPDGAPGSGDTMRAMKLGATDYLTKPFERSDLDEVLARAIASVAEPSEDSPQPEEPLRALPPPAIAVPFVARAPAMVRMTALLQRIAVTDVPVLLTGESGTGKEGVAREIHRLSQRSDRAFVKVSCASLPPERLESELFGHERGAFTGATAEKPGKLEVADRGTLFLDEIGEMPIRLQAKLLQALQDEELFRVGGKRSVRSDMRVVAATHRDLEREIEKGNFREDLFYRLNVVTIRVPPLRERREDIPSLIELFLYKYGERYQHRLSELPPEVLSAIQAHDWPGNVRELENTVRRMVVLDDPFAVLDALRAAAKPVALAPVLTLVPQEPNRIAVEAADANPFAKPQPPPPPMTIPESEISLKDIGKRAAMLAEREAILAMLQRTAWNKRKAAFKLRISYKALLYKIKESGIVDPRAHAEV